MKTIINRILRQLAFLSILTIWSLNGSNVLAQDLNIGSISQSQNYANPLTVKIVKNLCEKMIQVITYGLEESTARNAALNAIKKIKRELTPDNVLQSLKHLWKESKILMRSLPKESREVARLSPVFNSVKNWILQVQ